MKKSILLTFIALYGLNLSAHMLLRTVYEDNYRWLENMKDPKVISWFKQQAQLTDSVMNTISGRNELIAEWRKLEGINPALYILFSEAAGRFFLLKQNPRRKCR